MKNKIMLVLIILITSLLFSCRKSPELPSVGVGFLNLEINLEGQCANGPCEITENNKKVIYRQLKITLTKADGVVFKDYSNNVNETGLFNVTLPIGDYTVQIEENEEISAETKNISISAGNTTEDKVNATVRVLG